MSKTYHFIGIKGSGMSALALMLHQMGHKVQGSDVEKYYFTQRGLEQAGIPILPFDEKNITEDVELIAGNAFREDNNVEVAYAIKNGYSFKRFDIVIKVALKGCCISIQNGFQCRDYVYILEYRCTHDLIPPCQDTASKQ